MNQWLSKELDMIKNKGLDNGSHLDREVARLSARMDDLARRLAALESFQNMAEIHHRNDHALHPGHTVHIRMPDEKASGRGSAKTPSSRA